jgi:quercetin dioxygenase-like cupin family protein
MKKPTKKGLGLALLTVGLAGVLLAATMLPGSATPGINSVSTILARGTNQSSGTLPLMNGTDMVVAMNTFEVGGSSGWHSHPGGAIVVVQQGELTDYVSVGSRCVSTRYTAGQSFVERPTDLQNAVNTGSVQTIVYVLFPGVPVGGSARIDEPTDPGTCPGVWGLIAGAAPPSMGASPPIWPPWECVQVDLKDEPERRYASDSVTDRRVVSAIGDAGLRELLEVLTRSEADRAAMIGRLSQRADAEWLAELLIDLEEDESARLHLVEALRSATP